jgi:hypothetical protein
MTSTKSVLCLLIILMTGLLACTDDSLVKDKPDVPKEQTTQTKPDVSEQPSIPAKPQSEPQKQKTQDTQSLEQEKNVVPKLNADGNENLQPELPKPVKTDAKSFSTVLQSVPSKINVPIKQEVKRNVSEQKTTFQIMSDTNIETKALGNSTEERVNRPSNYDKKTLDLIKALMPAN